MAEQALSSVNKVNPRRTQQLNKADRSKKSLLLFIWLSNQPIVRFQDPWIPVESSMGHSNINVSRDYIGWDGISLTSFTPRSPYSDNIKKALQIPMLSTVEILLPVQLVVKIEFKTKNIILIQGTSAHGAQIRSCWRVYEDLNASGGLGPSVCTGLNALNKILNVCNVMLCTQRFQTVLCMFDCQPRILKLCSIYLNLQGSFPEIFSNMV